MFGPAFLHATFLLLPFSTDARDLTFSSVFGIKGPQKPMINDDGVDITTGSDFFGLMTFANLPYANCFKSSDMDAYDIAIMGAPFDTVSTPLQLALMVRKQGCDQSIAPLYTYLSVMKLRNIGVRIGFIG